MQKSSKIVARKKFKNAEKESEFNDIFVEIVVSFLVKNDEKNRQKIKFGMNF